MNRIAEKANKYSFSRELNNYVDNIQLDNNIKNKLQQLLANDKLFIDIEDKFKLILKNKYINDFIQQYPEYKQYCTDFNDDKIISYINNFIYRLEKKYLNEYAQKEIQDNLAYSMGSKVNNLTFSSQDPYFREAPIVICREFMENNQYEDHVLIGLSGEHHEQVIINNSELINRCYNKNNQLICAWLYLYPRNNVYISSRDINYYSSIDELVQILKNKFKQLNSIFYVKYQGNTRFTKRLAKNMRHL